MTKKQINELSKDKLSAYSAKASSSHTDAVLSADKKKLSKRTIGLGKAKALMKDETNVAEITNLIQQHVDQKPSEFADTFNELIRTRIVKAVADKKLELNQALFGAPKVEEETPIEDTPDDDEETTTSSD